MNATYSDAKSMKNQALAPTTPIQSASLEPSWPKIAPNIGLSCSFGDLAAILEIDNGTKIDPEIKIVSGITRNIAFYDRRPQKLQNEVPKLA